MLRRVAAALLICAVGAVEAQEFEPLNPMYLQTDDFVDEDMPTEGAGYLKIDGEDWFLSYFEPIASAVRSTYNGNPITTEFTSNKTGKTIRYAAYDSPNVYYAIMNVPGDEYKVYYGLVTCGYNSMDFVRKNPKEKWHVFSEIKPFLGTIVNFSTTDRQREDVKVHRASQWKAKGVKKPVGKLVRHGFPEYRGDDYETVTLQFNPGGTGTLTLVQEPFSEQFAPYTGGTINKRMPSGRTKSRTSIVLGGTLWWQHTAKRPFKWTMTDDGKLTVTPTGAVTMAYKEWLDSSPDNTVYTQKSDSIIARRQAENDLKYRHEDAIKRRAEVKKESKEAAEAFPEFTIDVEYITNGELLGKLNGKTIYLDSGKQGIMERYNPELYQKLDYWAKVGNERRGKGAQIRYDDAVRLIKLAIARDKAKFGTNPCYKVYDLSPYGRGKIDYIKPNELWTETFKLNSDGKMEVDSQTQHEPFKETSERIEQLNTELMAFKNDKMRSKVVKQYEKDYKKFKKNFDPDFYNWNGLEAAINAQKEFIKEQEETLELLKK